MAPLLMVFGVFLLLQYETEGSSTVTPVTPVTPVFLQTGKDLFLPVRKPVDLKENDFLWRYGRKNIVRHNKDKTIINRDYENRTKFWPQNFSLVIKDVRVTDSGFYRAVVSGEEDKTLSEYKVTVLDAVSPVVVTVTPDSRGRGFCNVTLTCRAEDSHINSSVSCYKGTCSQEGGERRQVTASGAWLHLYLVNGSAVGCNHSNLVSWHEGVDDAQRVCSLNADSNSTVSILAASVAVPVCVSVLIIIIIIAILMWRRQKKRRTYRSENPDNTICARPQLDAIPQPADRGQTHEASDPSSSSFYSMVGFPTGSVVSTPTTSNATPESLYAKVEKKT